MTTPTIRNRDAKQTRILNARYQAAAKDLQQYLESALPDLAKMRLKQGKDFKERAAFSYGKIIQIHGAVDHLEKMVENENQDLTILRSALETTESMIHTLKMAFVEGGLNFDNKKELDKQLEKDLQVIETEVRRIELGTWQSQRKATCSPPAGGGTRRNSLYGKNPAGNWAPEDHAIFERCYGTIKDDEIRLVDRVSQLCGLSKTAVKEHLIEYRKWSRECEKRKKAVEEWREDKETKEEYALRRQRQELAEKEAIRRQLAEAETVRREACRSKIAEWKRKKETKRLEEKIEKEAKAAMKLAKARRTRQRQVKIKSVVEEYKRIKTIKKLEEQRWEAHSKGNRRHIKERAKERQRLRHRNLKILSKRIRKISEAQRVDREREKRIKRLIERSTPNIQAKSKLFNNTASFSCRLHAKRDERKLKTATNRRSATPLSVRGRRALPRWRKGVD